MNIKKKLSSLEEKKAPHKTGLFAFACIASSLKQKYKEKK
jgi:hypothetical protein